MLSKIRGTIETLFRVGIGGPNLKNNGGVVEARNAGDAAFAIVRGATPTAPNDLTTKAYVDASASSGTGRFLGYTLRSVTGTFTTGPNTNTIRIRGVGAGGGGGGAAAGAGQAAVGGGGGAGMYNEETLAVTPNTAYSFVCGTPGASGASSGAPGGAGTESTFTVGGTTVHAAGGGGGGGGVNSTGPAVSTGGSGGSSGSANGVFNSGSGAPGHPGVLLSVTGPVGFGGPGGSCLFGGGGPAQAAAGSSGNGSRGFGFGGGGAFAGAGVGVSGSAGGGGAWIVEEYS